MISGRNSGSLRHRHRQRKRRPWRRARTKKECKDDKERGFEPSLATVRGDGENKEESNTHRKRSARSASRRKKQVEKNNEVAGLEAKVSKDTKRAGEILFQLLARSACNRREKLELDRCFDEAKSCPLQRHAEDVGADRGHRTVLPSRRPSSCASAYSARYESGASIRGG